MSFYSGKFLGGKSHHRYAIGEGSMDFAKGSSGENKKKGLGSGKKKEGIEKTFLSR